MSQDVTLLQVKSSDELARSTKCRFENRKWQNTANNNQILAAVITHMQDVRHLIHRVRIPYSKFSSPKMCRNVYESSLKINTIVLPLKRVKWHQEAIDTHACVVVSKVYDVTSMQNKKTRAHFSCVSFGEFLWKFVCFMI